MRLTVPFYMAIVIAILLPGAAHADGGMPMIILIWPASWPFLMLVIPIEAFVAKTIIGLDLKTAFKLSAAANLVSGIAGVPLTGLFLMVPAFIAVIVYLSITTNGGHLPGMYSDIISALIFSAFIGPGWGHSININGSSIATGWIFYPSLILFLVIPYYLSTVCIEYFVAKRFVKDNKKALSWSWVANTISYGLILLVLFGILQFILSTENKKEEKHSLTIKSYRHRLDKSKE